MHPTLIAFSLACVLALPAVGHAKPFRWAAQGDILTFDPHAQNEGLTSSANSYIYEPLVDYDQNFKVVPRLATDWKQVSPTVFRFTLRRDVRFQEGESFTADDVVFSIHRAMSPASTYKAYTTGIKAVHKIDLYTIDIETDAPNPVLLRQLPMVFMMSRAWAEKHDVLEPQEYNQNDETFATRHANGTGPYKLAAREVDVRTTFVENPDWWNRANKVGNVTQVTFTPIKQNATRTAALLSGELDFVLDPPAQDLDRLRRQAKVVEGNENRTIFLGYDQERPELRYSTIKGKNPFQDVRVREALYRAIDTEAIRRSVMRGLSAPTGTMLAKQVHGWTPELHERLPYDPQRARDLLKEAGYDGTLNFTLDCPNDRYINDEAICQAVVGMWAKVGVKASLNTMPRATYFPKLQQKDTSAYLLGWGVPTFDAMYTLQNLLRSKGEGADGLFNTGGYSNPEVDLLIDRIKTDTDLVRREADIQKVLAIHAREVGHIPLHDQVIPWAMRKNVNVVHRADNRLVLDWVTIED